MPRVERRAVLGGLVYTAFARIALLSNQAHAQSREQPLRLVFPFAAGGSGDALARLLADHIRTGLGVSVIVENKTGAAGRIGVQAVKGAPPDGNTILLTPIAPVAVYQHVYDPLGYDPVADFEPLAQVATFEFAVAVGPQVPAKTLKELVDWVRANPGAANYATPRRRHAAALLRRLLCSCQQPRSAPRRLSRLRRRPHRPCRWPDFHGVHDHLGPA